MNNYNERDDSTLIVRVFDLNIRDKLAEMERPAQATTPTAQTPTMNRRVTFIEAEHEYDHEDGYYDDDTTTNSSNENDSGIGATNRRNRRRNSSDNSLDSSLILQSINGTKSETTRSAEKTKREDLPTESLLDADGNVLAYLELDRLEKIFNGSENREKFEELYDKLASLKIDRIWIFSFYLCSIFPNCWVYFMFCFFISIQTWTREFLFYLICSNNQLRFVIFTVRVSNLFSVMSKKAITLI